MKRSETLIGQLSTFWQKRETTLVTLGVLRDEFHDHSTLVGKSAEEAIESIKACMVWVQQRSRGEKWSGKYVVPVRKKSTIIGYRTSEVDLKKENKESNSTGLGAGTKREGKRIWLEVIAEAFSNHSEYDKFLGNVVAKLKRIKFDVAGKMIKDKNYNTTKYQFPALLRKYEEAIEQKEPKAVSNEIRGSKNYQQRSDEGEFEHKKTLVRRKG